MPGFAGTLSEADIVSLLGYLRAGFSGKPPWNDAATIVADTMSGRTLVKLYGQDGMQRGGTPAGIADNRRGGSEARQGTQ